MVRHALRSGYEVVVLDNLSTGNEANLAGLDGVRLVTGDVRDAAAVDEALAGSIGVFHLAARVGNIRSLEDPTSDAAVNTMGALALIEGMRRNGIGRLVFSSSSAIYGEAKMNPVSEDQPCEPDSPYGVSKLAAEKYCQCFGRLYGWSVACLRYFNAFGVRQRFDAYGNVIPIFLRRLLRGEELIVYGDGDQTRDFVDVEDIARANLLAFGRRVSGAFNVATGKATSVNGLLESFARLWGGGVRVRHEEPRAGEVRHSCASIAKATAAFGYAPQIPLMEGLRRYVEWFRAESTAG